MNPLKLYNHDAVHVTTVMVGDYGFLPDVLIWGDRVFVRDHACHGKYCEEEVRNVFTQEELDAANKSKVFT